MIGSQAKVFMLSGNIKLLSLNGAFKTLRNGKRCRSDVYKFFAIKINDLMRIHRTAYREFEMSFNPKVHEIHAILVFGQPALYTKFGTISRNSGDLANMEKCLVDNVLTEEIDDSYIVSWNMKKIQTEVPYFKLVLEIVDRQKGD